LPNFSTASGSADSRSKYLCPAKYKPWQKNRRRFRPANGFDYSLI
jgi:hypothetical protein